MQKMRLWLICFLGGMIVQFMHPNYCRAFSIVTVNVLIHNGIHASANSVNGTVACLSTANYHNLVPGVWFTWGFNGTINASTLSGYDVLVMPGGDGFGSGYRLDPNINSNDIKNWIATGKGYYGTCAGAYGGTSTVYDYAPNTTSVRYYAWGLAPHVNAIATASDSTALTVSMTSAGQYTLNNSGTLTLRYINGPAMKENTPGGTVFAIYADNITGYPGHIAIVGDTYGSGRTILCGPHPELSPQKPELVARLTAWAGKAIDTQIPVELFDFDAIDEPANN